MKKLKYAVFLSGASLIALAAGGIANAQESQDTQAQEAEADVTTNEEQRKLETVTVTGTLIRGAEAVGSQTIQLDEDAITVSGASTTNELLGELPQVANFFNQRFDNDPRVADRLQVTRPNLRNLPGVLSATGSTTLLLVAGHRVTPMGVDQASFDPDFIPPGAIQRIEVVTDGGSSLYGADAVGGVINFITKDEYDGIEIDGGIEIGDDYSAWNAGFTAGTSWDRGNAYISYAAYQRDDLVGYDRDFAAQGQWNADGTVLTPAGTQCIEPVGSLQTWFWFGAGWTNNPAAPGVTTTPVGEPCDTDAGRSLIPELDRQTVLFGVSQEIADNISFKMKAHYGESTTKYSMYPLGDTFSEPSPNEQGIVGSAIGQLYETAAVGFSYGANSAYVKRQQEVELETYSISPELTFDLGNSWRLVTLAHVGHSESKRARPLSDRVALLSAINSGALDPTNVAAADASVITAITDFEAAGEAIQELVSLRAIADGEVFKLPAGMVRAAVGVEFNYDNAELREGNFARGVLETQPFDEESRGVKSVFGELSIPVLSNLDFSVSGRYDEYSDFGDTFNPNIGVDYTPIEGMKFYAKWGESFNAPTVIDSLGTANARFIADAAAGVPDPNGELVGASNNDVLLLEGTGGDLAPQTAENWSIGFDNDMIKNFSFGVNYYDIDFQNLLSSVDPTLASVVLLNPDKFVFNPTQAEYDALLAQTINGVEQFGNINAADVGVIIDRRVANIGSAHLTGFDFYANYVHDTDIGEINVGVSGNKQLVFDLTDNGNTVDNLRYDIPDLYVGGHVGWRNGPMQAKVSLKYSGSFDADPTTAVNQSTVDSFVVTDLFFGYQFAESSNFSNGLSLRLNIDNVFDEDPPVFRQQRNLNYSGFTLGRVFKLSFTKAF